MLPERNHWPAPHHYLCVSQIRPLSSDVRCAPSASQVLQLCRMLWRHDHHSCIWMLTEYYACMPLPRLIVGHHRAHHHRLHTGKKVKFIHYHPSRLCTHFRHVHRHPLASLVCPQPRNSLRVPLRHDGGIGDTTTTTL